MTYVLLIIALPVAYWLLVELIDRLWRR